MSKREIISIEALAHNRGQINGMPPNPQQWTQEDLEAAKNSIIDIPELLEARPPIVVKRGKSFVILDGSIQVEALRALGTTEVECEVVPKDTPVEKLAEIVIKSKSQFGRWDSDLLDKDWKDLDLVAMGINENVVASNKSQTDTQKEQSESLSFNLSTEDFERVSEALRGFDNDKNVALKMALGL